MSPITGALVGFGLIIAVGGWAVWIAVKSIKEEREKRMKHH
jgi:arginine exporter protein ArgO